MISSSACNLHNKRGSTSLHDVEHMVFVATPFRMGFEEIQLIIGSMRQDPKGHWLWKRNGSLERLKDFETYQADIPRAIGESSGFPHGFHLKIVRQSDSIPEACEPMTPQGKATRPPFCRTVLAHAWPMRLCGRAQALPSSCSRKVSKPPTHRPFQSEPDAKARPTISPTLIWPSISANRLQTTSWV